MSDWEGTRRGAPSPRTAGSVGRGAFLNQRPPALRVRLLRTPVTYPAAHGGGDYQPSLRPVTLLGPVSLSGCHGQLCWPWGEEEPPRMRWRRRLRCWEEEPRDAVTTATFAGRRSTPRMAGCVTTATLRCDAGRAAAGYHPPHSRTSPPLAAPSERTTRPRSKGEGGRERCCPVPDSNVHLHPPVTGTTWNQAPH